MERFLLTGSLLWVMGCASLSPIPQCEELKQELPEDVTPPTRLEMVTPPPPRDGTPYGFACVEATINLDGRVVEAVVLKTNHPVFARSFLEALRNWRYEPATRAGEAVEVRVVLSSSFR